MEQKCNCQTFTPEEVENGKFIEFLMAVMRLGDNYDIKITSDGYCKSIEWVKTYYVRDDGTWDEPTGEHFVYKDDNEEWFDDEVKDND